MDRFDDHTILYRFFKKETSEGENEEIIHWVSASEENREEFRKVHKIFLSSNFKQFQSEIDIDDAWDKLYQSLKEYRSHSGTLNVSFLLKVAASVLILVAVGLGSIWTYEHIFKGSTFAIVHIEAPAGEKSKIQLADGSSVWLNSETVLTYDATNPRNVRVEGEAFFDIQKDAGNPFWVETASGMTVKVTGTRFNLRSYAGDPFVETTLEEGRVEILGENAVRLAELNPGQQARYTIRGGEVEVKKVSPELYSLWKNNEIIFSETSFYDLVPQIERWYGVSVELDEGINKEDRFTMTIKTESLRELLDMMKLTSDFDYEIVGSRVKIYSK
jgi:ferric-dicitrate binding protein FerR (iron transport regulator)